MAAIIAGSAVRPMTTASQTVGTHRGASQPFTMLRPCAARQSVKVHADPEEKAQQTASGDSYQKIEEPVRSVFPDNSDSGAQNFGPTQSEADEFFKSKTANPDTEVFGTEVGLADAMRFKGAAPEVINCRLAMLGFAAAVIVEATTGKNVIEQAKAAPVPIALISLTFIVASIIPIVRGVPRRGNSIFTADAELWNGRLAMLGIAALFWNAYISSSSLTPVA